MAPKNPTCMRRIFGGSSSSPNPQTDPSSGSSDPSYESPLPAHPSISRNSPPTPAISDSTTKSSGSRWLGQALGGVTESIRRNGRGHTRNSTDTSATETVSSNASGGGGGTNGIHGSGSNGYGHRNGGSTSRIQEEDSDEIDASSRSYALNRSSPPSTSLISPTSQEFPRISTNLYSGANDRNEASSSRAGSNVGEEKDAIMVELLSSQAIIESREYQIMSWDEMIQVKKVRSNPIVFLSYGGRLSREANLSLFTFSIQIAYSTFIGTYSSSQQSRRP